MNKIKSSDWQNAKQVKIKDSGSYYTGTEVESALQIIGKSRADSYHYTGFPNRDHTGIGWDDGTYILTLIATDDKIWISGVEYEIDTLKKQLSVAQEAVSGLYWFWITAPGGTPQLNTSTTVLDIGSGGANAGFDQCLVAVVYWNTTTSKGLMYDERHWFGRDAWMHEYLHETVGARFYSGMAGTFGNTTFEVESGEFYDEDIEHLNDAETVATILYHDGDADWKWDTNTSTPYKTDGTDLQYNNGTTLAAAGNNRYVNYFVFMTPDPTDPVHIIVGTATYTTAAGAATAAVPSLGALPSEENKLIYKITYKNNSGGTPAYQSTTDFRTSSLLPVTGYVPTDHGSLSGLSDDDHAQYALLAGRDGESLAIDEIKAYDGAGLKLYDDGGNGIFVEDGGNVGIGTTGPSRKLDVAGTGDAYMAFTASSHNQWVIGSEQEGFVIYDDTNNEYRMAIGKTDNAGVSVGTSYAGTDAPSNGMIIEGNVGIGTTGPGGSGTVGTKVLSLGNGTPPVGGVADQVSLFSKDVAASAELFALDEAGNTPQLSPHNFTMFTPDPDEPYPWSYYACNPYLGKCINVDLAGAIRAIEEVSGETFIYYEDMPEDEVLSWDDQQAAYAITENARRLAEAAAVLTPTLDAIEAYSETITVETGETVITYELDTEIGKVIEVSTPITTEILTGKTLYRLKEGCELDKDTGIFMCPIGEENAVYEEYETQPMPGWMATRIIDPGHE